MSHLFCSDWTFVGQHWHDLYVVTMERMIPWLSYTCFLTGMNINLNDDPAYPYVITFGPAWYLNIVGKMFVIATSGVLRYVYYIFFSEPAVMVVCSGGPFGCDSVYTINAFERL